MGVVNEEEDLGEDGLNSLRYTLVEKRRRKLFVLVRVNLVGVGE